MLAPLIQKKYDHLQTILREMNSVALGYSGGVDSTLLLRVAVDILGDSTVAIIGKSETYPTREFEDALALAREMGARYRVVQTEETDILKFKENPPDRCYFCKTELFSKVQEVAQEEGIRWIADGTIVDDIGDFRPGMRARSEQQVRSPLLEAGLTKVEIREISRELGLPTWDKPSFACLSSRFPYGMGITKENLRRIDEAESYLRDHGFRAFRVRFHDSSTARIEVDPDDIARLANPVMREDLVKHLKNLGFTYVTLDLQGYRTGSMNEILPENIKNQYRVKDGADGAT